MHEPVLKEQVLEYLNPKPGFIVLDATVGGGGHTEALAERVLPSGMILGLDQDEEAIKHVKARLARFGQHVQIVESNFRNLDQVLSQYPDLKFDAALFDLGFSSDQIADSKRGFSFMADAPLDMRMSLKFDLKAADLINSLSERELADIFWKYGEEHASRRIAKVIVEERRTRPVQTTFDLLRMLEKAGLRRKGKAHPATKVFQALRIAVNDELGACEEGIRKAISVLKSGGRIATITFHSLEDRIVKNLFKAEEKEGRVKIITRKVVMPSRAEVLKNPRARSAKLRVAERV